MRECIIETKSGATWNTLVELENIISEENFATKYLGESGEWFANKLEHSGAHDRDGFSDQEYL